MEQRERIERATRELEAGGFRDVYVEEGVPYVAEYPWGERETTYEPFALAHTKDEGMALVKRSMLGWDGDGYAHVRMDRPGTLAPKRREAFEGFLSRARGKGLL
jgi:hypothetical protein